MKPGENILELDEQRQMLELLIGLRRNTLDNKPHIQEYYRIRNMHQGIVDSMVKYYQDGKFEQKIDPDYVMPGDQIPLRQRENKFIALDCNFDLRTNEGAQAFFDMMIYKPAPNMNCITEAYIQNQRYKRPEKMEFLHSMLSSKLGLYAITETDWEEGYVYLKEAFTGEELKIVDVGLSGNSDFEDIYIYTRIITHKDVSFNTGLGIFFSKSDGFIGKYIQRKKKDYSPNGQILMFTELYNRYTKYPNRFKIITNRL